MKKVYVLLIALLFVSGLFSQTKLLRPAEIYVGTSHGATGAMVFFKKSVPQDFLFGYSGGFMFRYVNEKYRALQVELNFTQRGWQEKDKVYARQLNYLELPFMSHFYYGNRTRVFLNLGPQVAFLLSEKTLINNGEEPSAENHIRKIQNKFDYGFCGGFGLQFSVKRQNFQLETRANFSLSSIFSSKQSDPFKSSQNAFASVKFAWLMRVR